MYVALSVNLLSFTFPVFSFSLLLRTSLVLRTSLYFCPLSSCSSDRLRAKGLRPSVVRLRFCGHFAGICLRRPRELQTHGEVRLYERCNEYLTLH